MKNEKLAFPMFNNQKGDCSRDDFIYESGMTLRDYFAGQALVALIPEINGDIDDFDLDYFSEKFAQVFGKAAYNRLVRQPY